MDSLLLFLIIMGILLGLVTLFMFPSYSITNFKRAEMELLREVIKQITDTNALNEKWRKRN